MSRYTRRINRFDTDDATPGFVAALVAALAVAPLAALVALPSAWLLMLALGSAHDQWPVIPALGYWTTYILLVGASLVTGLFKKG